MEATSREFCDYSIISIPEAGEAELAVTSAKGHERIFNPRFSQFYQNTHLDQHSLNYMLYSSGGNQHNNFGNRSASEGVSENIISVKKPSFNQLMSTDQQNQMDGEDNLMPSSFTAEGVWEAYNEKCRECERLRDDLEESKSEVYKLKQSISRKQTIEDERIVSSSTEHDRCNEIEHMQMLNDELKSKNLLAKDELEKATEYYEREIRERDGKYEEARNEVEKLKNDLVLKEKEQMETLRDCEQQSDSKTRQLETQISGYKSRISDLEEQLNRQKERCAELERATNMSEFQRSTGLPSICSPSLLNSGVGGGGGGGLSSGDLSSLLNHVRSLNCELISVKRRAHLQRKAMNEVCKNPIIAKTLRKVLDVPHSNGVHTAENEVGERTHHLVPLSGNESSFDNRQIDAVQTTESNRKVESLFLEPKPSDIHKQSHCIEIPKDPELLSEAFKSLQNEVKKREFSEPAESSGDGEAIIRQASDVLDDCITSPILPAYPTPKHFKAKWPKKPTIVKSVAGPPSGGDEAFDCTSSSKTTVSSSHRHHNQKTLSTSTKSSNSFLPANHPSKRPSSRAHPDQAHSSRSDQQLELQKKFAACPVCQQTFDVSSSNELIRRHVNGHFSDGEDALVSDDEPEDLVKVLDTR